MMNWLGLHPDIACHQRELWDLMLRRPHELIAKLYNDLPANAKIKGYKSPAELTQNHILEYHSRLWPHVKFFVGIRVRKEVHLGTMLCQVSPEVYSTRCGGFSRSTTFAFRTKVPCDPSMNSKAFVNSA